MNQEGEYNQELSSDNKSLSEREQQDIALLNLLKKINIDQKDPIVIIQLFGSITTKISQICELYYQYEEYEKILSYYNMIYEKYLVAIDAFEDSEEQSGYYLPILRDSFEYWKTRIDWLKKENTRHRLNIGNMLLIEGKYETALNNFDHALKYDKNNQELLNKKGISLFFLGKYEDALKCFECALLISEKSLHTLYNLALTYEMLKNNSKAIEFYNKVLQINENHLSSLTSLGIIYYRKKNYKLASEFIERAYQIKANDWRILLVKGIVLSDGFQEYINAKLHLEQALELNPNSSLIKLNLANILIILEEYNKSLEILNNVHKSIENIEDRSSAIILRILLICNLIVQKKQISMEIIEELIKYCNLKDLNLIEWDFNNLKKYISKLDLQVNLKKLLCLILSIPDLQQSDKKIYLDGIISISKNILFPKHRTNASTKLKGILSVDPEQIKIVKNIEPNIFKKNSYNWRLSISAPDHILDLIESVEYILDPNYSDNIQRKFSKDNGFALEGIGRIESNFEIKIIMKDKTIYNKYVQLKL